MIYILLILGIIICFYGCKIKNSKNQIQRETFKELIIEQEEKSEYIKLLSSHQELKIQCKLIEEKLDKVLTQIEDKYPVENSMEEPSVLKEEKEEVDGSATNYGEAANNIQKMIEQNKTIDEMAMALQMGKGEVLLLKNLLQK